LSFRLIIQSDDAMLRAVLLSDPLRDAEAFATTFPSKLLHFLASLTMRPNTSARDLCFEEVRPKSAKRAFDGEVSHVGRQT
jgi:hypothetical protein